ncbi:unnamed protein product [Spodoptera littoralis]|uniref:Uncharacterized protein n=1 Tax=Spodoptera littoralis TaxID=7109 RepID=A0A9P0IBR2_SPOLI|nr:unnamed protein product [Spodoptera littoralis]
MSSATIEELSLKFCAKNRCSRMRFAKACVLLLQLGAVVIAYYRHNTYTDVSNHYNTIDVEVIYPKKKT